MIPDGTVCSPTATSPIPPLTSKCPDDGRVPYLDPGGHPEIAAFTSDRPAEQHEPCEEEPAAGHQERRDGVDRDGHAEVGRAPDEVEDEHPEQDRRARE